MPRECGELSFEASRQAWEELRGASGDTYYLQARRSDRGPDDAEGEPACLYVYTLQVLAGVPSTLTMAPRALDGQDIASCDPAWEEDEASFGSHSAELQPWTMDMHYEACEREVLSQDPQDASISLCAFDNGALAHCSYFPNECADGCSAGPKGYEYGGIDFWNFGFGLLPG